MGKEMILKQARIIEFWNTFLTENFKTNSFTFFGGTNLKNDDCTTSLKIVLETEDVKKVQQLCNNSDVLIYNFYLCTLNILLAKYEEKVSFISSVAQFKNFKEVDKVFGLQLDIDNENDFKTNYSVLKTQLLKSLENAIDWSELEKQIINHGYEQKIRTFQLNINDDNKNVSDYITTIFNFDLKGKSPEFEILVKGEMYDKNLLKLFGENFKKLLSEIIQNTYEPIKKIEYRGVSEQEVLNAINKPKMYFSLNDDIVKLINDKCQEQNEKIAIIDGLENITYGDFYKRTNKLARYLLQEFNAEKDNLFGIMLSRSINMVSGIFAVWKAGSAYVPIATNLSDEALIHIIENSSLKAILTDDTKVLEQINRLGINISVISLNENDPKVNSLSDTPVNINIDPKNLAYVIYTSGSTGKPKGAMIEHFGMLNHIGAKIKEMAINDNSIVAQNAPHTFDISVWQFFAPLVAGGTSVIYDEEVVIDADEFVNKIAEDKITLLELVPSYLLEMLNYIESGNSKIQLYLNTVILNAETLTKAMVKRWLDLYPNVPIINTYGATEVSDDISHYFMSEIPENYSVPVMKDPIQNFEVHIINEYNEKVPVGVKGEILLAGPCVGRGYFNDEKRTKEAFLKGPIDGITSHDRIYKTGDLGRFMPDGTMEFIGRNDNQIKISGHRIELDAIENVVAELDQVKSVKAIADVEKQFIALYYVSDEVIERSVLEDKILKKLSKYMLPSVFIHMNVFPLTPNGKIDKKALPNPSDFTTFDTVEYIAPINEIEEKIVAIWQKLLEVERIGTTHDFFSLGGHSLKLMRLKNEYQKLFNVNIKIKEFYENVTIKSHLNLIDNSKKVEYEEIRNINEALNYAISDAQKRLWVLSQFEDGSVVYNMPFQIILSGNFNVELFEKAINAVIDRHEILRTVFKEEDNGDVRQWILKREEIGFELGYHDFVGTPSKIEDFVREDSFKPFNLESGPLLRATLFKKTENEYLFYYNMHHIIGDAWSTEVIIKDVMAYYNAYKEGKSPSLPKLRIQYKDYAAWQLDQIEEESFDIHKRYWKQKLSGDIPLLELTSTLKRPKVKTNKGKILGTYLSKEISNHLKNFCKQEGGSLFMGLVASLNALFYKYTSQEDIIIGSPIAGRNHPDLENQIGFYVNTLVLRNQVNSEESFKELFKKVKDTTLEAYEHQQYPFDRLVEELDIRRDMSRNPIFNIMVVLQNAGDNTIEISTESENIDDIFVVNSIPSKFDIEITFQEQDLISFYVNYNTDVYTDEIIENFIHHYKNLLLEILKQSEESIGSIDYLSIKEKNSLLFDFNNTKVDYPIDSTILDLFSQKVAKEPEAIAVVFEDKILTFKELDEKSNQLASFLFEKGIKKEQLIPIFIERSFEMIITILGILKAGGAYVPIDIDYPVERIQYILNDIDANFVFTTSNFRGMFDNIYLVELDQFHFEDFSNKALKNKVSPNQLAYCIYTSGTTGMPKGVLNEHSGLLNRLLWMQDDLIINTESVILQKTNYSFDVSVWELLMPIISGCKLIMCRPGGHKEPRYLQEIIKKEKVSILHFVPSMLDVFLRDAQFDNCASLKHIICSGEALSSNTVIKCKKIFPEVSIHNLYGPTEAAIDVTSIDLKLINTEEEGVSIGKPVANTQIYILDQGLNVQPIGVVGELLIGGVQVARGYLNKPELTSEKFIKSPFKEGERLYKTGDLARWLSNGNIEYVGRNDHQVKIRGNRIELNEIEKQLLRHENVQEAVALVFGNDENKQLVIYFVSDQELTSTQLRKFLSINLPDYMLPNAYIQVEAIPLTSNGKVDRKALLNLESKNIKSGIDYIAPRNIIEDQLVQIWGNILGKELIDISIDIGFFELGGNSLQIIRLGKEIQKKFKKEISVVQLFQNATIRLQAEMLLDTKLNLSESTTQSDITYNNLDNDIAVIGMSIKVPGAEDVSEFWKNLKDGVESISHFSDEELIANGISEELLKNENYIKAGSYLDGKDNFDASFFGYLPDEAKSMDPQTRVFHEVVWSALEDAGYNPLVYAGLIGLYAGGKTNIKWQIHNIINKPDNVDEFTAAYLGDKDFTNSLIAHKLNLKGAVNTVNTACSTSLVAVHYAVRSLLNGENDLAIAGGITLRSNLKEGYMFKEGMINSKDGHNRTFDKLASGTISGEGAGAVVLKRLDKAILDNDNILAVIKGSAINNDGNRKVGYTAPSIDGQVEVVKTAQKIAKINPQAIGYIEAHGTATKLGDLIEVEALNQVFGSSNEKYCGLGSVKSNLGHLDAAAGIVGFIKTVLCIKNKKLVPSLHFDSPNLEIDFERGPFYVNTEFKNWDSKHGVLRAGVSSFGIGGTNAHIILEESPQLEPSSKDESQQIIVLSAKSNSSLLKQKEKLQQFLIDNAEVNFADLSWTLQTRKSQFEHRLSFAAKNKETVIDILNSDVKKYMHENRSNSIKKKIAFMFSGQGSQYVNMGKDLYEKEIVFRETVDNCFKIAESISNVDYKNILYPKIKENEKLINETKYTQPILFVFEYALAKLLEKYGVKPDIMIGHSIGEYVAACLSDVISLEDAIKLVIKRGELIQKLPTGNMLSVGLSVDELYSFLTEEISVAAINTKNSSVLSGTEEEISKLAEILHQRGIVCQKLLTSHAFHSKMMSPIENIYADYVLGININKPKIPYISNVTGKEVSSQELMNNRYWSDHILKTVKFSEGLEEILTHNDIILIEIGPGNTLTNFVRQHQRNDIVYDVLSLIRHRKEQVEDYHYFLDSLGKLWRYGGVLDWHNLHKNEIRRPVSLPTYPFEKVKFPLGENIYNQLYTQLSIPNTEKRLDSSKWFYEPSWKQGRLYLDSTFSKEDDYFIIFKDNSDLAELLINKIKTRTNRIIEVHEGNAFGKIAENKYLVDPSNYDNYEELFLDFEVNGIFPKNIIHLFNISSLPLNEENGINSSLLKNRGFYSLLFIAKNINKLKIQESVNLTVVTNDLQLELSNHKNNRLQSLNLGLLNVIAQENPLIKSRNIDFSLSDDKNGIVGNLFNEINSEIKEKNIAYRLNNRWIKGYDRIKLTKNPKSKIKEKGVYFITGGLGNLGFEYAKLLIEKYEASVILLGRKEINANEVTDGSDEKKIEILRLTQLQEKGNVLYYNVDITDEQAMRKIVILGESVFGKINGVIHAAGITQGRSIRGINFITEEDCEQQFVAKVSGVNILTEIFKEAELDFCLLVSSLSSVLGGKEFASYASANAYLDHLSNTKVIKNIISVNFDGLNFSDREIEEALNRNEMGEVLESVLSLEDTSQVLISVSDLEERIEKWVNTIDYSLVDNTKDKNLRIEINRKNFSTTLSIPETETEMKLLRLFEDFFGVKGVGVDDDFFDLGGDSLRAMTISNHIYKMFDVELSLKDFFMNPTIKSLGKEIDLARNFKNIKEIDTEKVFENESII